MTAAVMGAGMWGTTFAQVLWDAGTPAMLWGRRPDLVASINERHENPDYLPGISLPAGLTASAEPDRVLMGDGRQQTRHGADRAPLETQPPAGAQSADRRAYQLA